MVGSGHVAPNNFKHEKVNMKHDQTLRAAFSLAFLTILAACSSGPSESDAKAALLKSAERSGISMVNPDYKQEIAKAKLVGCVKAEAGGYACDVSSAHGTVGNMRFVKTDAGWSVVN
jgi:hypothetical protein